ncbi:MAG: DMT family transporter [Betaproteobacteria bacterium]|jgi:S-adenosylmethionine uptake transporter|nr:DMT family transporter [Betaproteobacteria bacterium]
MQALWMVLASLFFSTMSVCVKFAATHFNTFELVCYRGAIGTLIMAVICQRKGMSLKTPVPQMHLWRSVVGVTSLAAWFYAIAYLPLATAMTLNYMSGVWVAAFLVGSTMWAGSLQNAKQQMPVALTVLVGFVGVVMILRPTFEQNQWLAGLIGVSSGVIAAMAYLQVAALGREGEPVERTVFYFSLGAAVSGAVCMLFTGTSEWVWPHAWLLLPMGILAALGQWCMTRAYNDGATMVVANLQYSGIVFSALFGMLLFGDQIPLIGWAGIMVIVMSAIAATVLRSRIAMNLPVEDH